MIFFSLAVFAGLSLNLIIQFALGAGIAGKNRSLPVLQIVILFLAVVLLWILFAYILNFLPWELTVFFLMFPSSVIVCMCMEFLASRFFPKRKRLFSGMTAYEGLVLASLILTYRIARTFSDAILLSFFFALGCLLALVFVNEIRRRSFLEKIPENFRGMPLTFISLGLLSMVISTTVWILDKVMGG